MGIFAQACEYLGLGRLPLHHGFTTSERNPRLPVCTTFGAVVDVERRALHEEWHAADPP